MPVTRSGAVLAVLGILGWGALFAICLGPALFGHPVGSVAGMVAVIGPFLRLWQENVDLWRMSASDRGRTRHGINHGVPTGDPQLDVIVLDRLRGAVRRWGPATFMVLALLVVSTALFPVLAAVRTHDPRYLWCLAGVVMLLLWSGPLLRGRTAARRLERFETSLAAQRKAAAGDGG